MFDKPTPDWTKPVRFNTGEPVQAERVSSHILITFDPNNYPPALEPVLATKHFKDTFVVYEDDGTIVGHDHAPIWVENTTRTVHPMEAIYGSF